MITPTAAELLLLDLGVAAPSDIDLDAIAFDVGAEVKRAPLRGHEARIVGVGDRAIIWVDSGTSYRRQRFSIGHELGHWHHHRGASLYCASSDIGSERAIDAERVANRFSADLLMPWYLFLPALASFNSPSWETVSSLSSIFNTSRPATAIRIVASNQFSLVLTCHRTNGSRWFQRAPCVPESWYVNDTLDTRTTTFEVLYGTADSARPRSITASAWFTRRDASRFQVREQCIRSEYEVYTLLWFTDRKALSG